MNYIPYDMTLSKVRDNCLKGKCGDCIFYNDNCQCIITDKSPDMWNFRNATIPDRVTHIDKNGNITICDTCSNCSLEECNIALKKRLFELENILDKLTRGNV